MGFEIHTASKLTIMFARNSNAKPPQASIWKGMIGRNPMKMPMAMPRATEYRVRLQISALST